MDAPYNHIADLERVWALCLNETSANPVEVLERLMDEPFCRMHGPEHHILVGSALLTAYKNAGGAVNLQTALHEMARRGNEVPAGACGSWGACGAGLSAGMFLSIVAMSSPLAVEPWGLANRLTSAALEKIGIVGGPRCCKRDSYLAVLATIHFVREHLGISMDTPAITCTRSARNAHCLRTRCPFSPLHE